MGTIVASIITGIILAAICILIVLIGWACLVAALVDRRTIAASYSPASRRP